MLVMYNKISDFWDWLDIDIIFNPVVIFSYKFWLNLWDRFCFKQNSWDELSYKFWLNFWGSFCFALIYTSIVICTRPICADIYVKWQADKGFLTPSEAYKVQLAGDLWDFSKSSTNSRVSISPNKFRFSGWGIESKTIIIKFLCITVIQNYQSGTKKKRSVEAFAWKKKRWILQQACQQKF